MATLDNIVSTIQESVPDVLYLVCHSYLDKEQPVLVLENEQGLAEKVQGREFAIKLSELKNLPHLVLLISCQNSEKPGENGFSVMGLQLMEVGVPSVLAMQDNLSLETAAQFIPAFFKELQRDGQIDRAVSVARGVVRERPDAWVPTLTTRLKSGRLWYTPGFGESRKGFEEFPAIIQNIRKGRCTPILGSGLTEALFGSQREIARRWAQLFNYPMMAHEREELHQVAQFLATKYNPNFPIEELEETIKNQLHSYRAENTLLDNARDTNTLNGLIKALGAEQRLNDPNDPHKLLAELPLPVFITTNADPLLEEALRAAGKSPENMLCPWNDYIEQAETVFDRDPDYEPSPARPLVFHLFGRWDEPLSVVLTEDNYFDFLIGVIGNRNRIPEFVRQMLSDSGMLFLGFQTEEWNFRVLCRSILEQGLSRRSRYVNIAVQNEPEGERLFDLADAKHYLEKYFSGADISIYWGSPGEFLGELLRRWREIQV
jgi:hypothetical protein